MTDHNQGLSTLMRLKRAQQAQMNKVLFSLLNSRFFLNNYNYKTHIKVVSNCKFIL